jgi:hypothetical protein
MGKARVVVHRAGVDEVFQAPGVSALLNSTAGPVLAEAIRTAPVVTGNYKNSLGARETTAAALGIHFRAGSDNRPVVIVEATAPHAHLVEAQSGVLARALNAAGG